MKRVLLITNGQSPSFKSLEFASSLVLQNEASLTGILIDNADAEVVSSSSNGRQKAAGGEVVARQVKLPIVETARQFKELCKEKAVPFNLFKIEGDPVNEIINESLYHDVVVIDPAISIYAGEEAPSALFRDVLSRIECPVIVSPAKKELPDDAIFCFDGSESSIFALKQMSYLFPEMKSRKLVVLEVNHGSREGFSERHRRMQAWVNAHFTNVENIVLSGDVRSALFNFLSNQQGKLVVMGAYGRSQISQFFRRSTADDLIGEVDLPFFITHL